MLRRSAPQGAAYQTYETAPLFDSPRERAREDVQNRNAIYFALLVMSAALSVGVAMGFLIVVTSQYVASTDGGSAGSDACCPDALSGASNSTCTPARVALDKDMKMYFRNSAVGYFVAILILAALVIGLGYWLFMVPRTAEKQAHVHASAIAKAAILSLGFLAAAGALFASMVYGYATINEAKLERMWQEAACTRSLPALRTWTSIVASVAIVQWIITYIASMFAVRGTPPPPRAAAEPDPAPLATPITAATRLVV